MSTDRPRRKPIIPAADAEALAADWQPEAPNPDAIAAEARSALHADLVASARAKVVDNMVRQAFVAAHNQGFDEGFRMAAQIGFKHLRESFGHAWSAGAAEASAAAYLEGLADGLARQDGDES